MRLFFFLSFRIRSYHGSSEPWRANFEKDKWVKVEFIAVNQLMKEPKVMFHLVNISTSPLRMLKLTETRAFNPLVIRCFQFSKLQMRFKDSTNCSNQRGPPRLVMLLCSLISLVISSKVSYNYDRRSLAKHKGHPSVNKAAKGRKAIGFIWIDRA